jgi:DNA-directed RNA polymerase subunit RPC12/RpoP
MKNLFELLGDVLLGGRCPYCSDRVFPKDRCAHRYDCTGRIKPPRPSLPNPVDTRRSRP